MIDRLGNYRLLPTLLLARSCKQSYNWALSRAYANFRVTEPFQGQKHIRNSGGNAKGLAECPSGSHLQTVDSQSYVRIYPQSANLAIRS